MIEFTYSIIIPTRNRSETALHAIISCIRTGYQKIQIIVQDNSDDDALYNLLVNNNLINKINYYKNSYVLPMHENWECALEKATGDYVCIIGDDDGLFPDALKIANVILSKTNVEVLRTRTAVYKWPDYPFPSMANYIFVPLEINIIRNNNLKSLLLKSLSHEVEMGTGPGIYHGFLSKGFLKSLKSQRGKYFIEHIPDFDSGYAVMMYAKEIITVERPLIMSGHSRKSNSGKMRSGALTGLSAKIYSHELKNQSNESLNDLFFENIETVASTIVATQFRMLPEIKKIFPDLEIKINEVGALKFIAKQLTTGYEKISFISNIESLTNAAVKFNCYADIKLIIDKFHLSPELGAIQGLTHRKKSDSSNQPDSSKSMIVNGQLLNLKNINDAISVASSILPSMLRFVGEQSSEEYKYLTSQKSSSREELLNISLEYINVMNFSKAELILIDLTMINGSDFDAYYHLGRLRNLNKDYQGSLLPLERCLSLKINFDAAEIYIDSLSKLDLQTRATSFLELIKPYATTELRKKTIIKLSQMIDSSQ